MDNMITTWLDATDEAMAALVNWRSALAEWQLNGGEMTKGDFDKAYSELYQIGLGDWTEGVDERGDCHIDALAEAVKRGT